MIKLERAKQRYDIPWQLHTNMDEKGIQLSEDNSRDLVIVSEHPFSCVDSRAGGSKQSGNRQTITAIETCCADGTMAPPMIIFLGGGKSQRMPPQYLSGEQRKSMPKSSRFAVTESGWSNSKMAEEWVVKLYIPWINQKRAALGMQDRWALLIFDGHGSHPTYGFLQDLEKARIHPLGLPAHTSDKLQPNDVALFGPLSTAYKSILSDALDMDESVTLRNFLSYYERARIKAYVPRNVESAFRPTGIVPCNPLQIEIIRLHRERERVQSWRSAVEAR